MSEVNSVDFKEMTMNDYQYLAGGFIAFEDNMYPVLALAEEAGEVLGKFAKLARGDETYAKMSKAEFDEVLIKELGDVLFNIAALCTTRNISLDYVANENIRKLLDRKNRNVIKGNGDNR